MNIFVKNNYFSKIVFGCVLMLAGCYTNLAYAQDPTVDENLKGSLTIDKSAKLELKPANRNFEKITNIQTEEAPKEVTYSDFQEVELMLPKLDTKIKVVTLKSAELTKLYGNYLKIGFGNYVTPYAELFLNNKRNEKYAYGAHFMHLSSKNGPVLNAGNSFNLAEVYGNYFTKTTVISANIAYSRRRHNFYGYDHSAFPIVDEDTLKQTFNTISAYLSFENKNKKSDLNYITGFGFYNLETYKTGWENEFLWDLTTSYKLNNTMNVQLIGGISYSQRYDSSLQNRIFGFAKPSLAWQISDRLNFNGGLNLAYTNDTVADSPKFHVYPNAKAEYKVFENKLVVFGGIEGNMQKNTLRSFSMENPFLNRNVVLLHTNKLHDFYGGILGGLKGGVNYKINLSSASYKYLSFLNNSATDSTAFAITYDTAPVDVFTVSGELSYDFSDAFRAAFASSYFNYDVRTVEKPWHRPDYTGSLLLSYNLEKKLYFNADFYYIGGLRGKNLISGREHYLKEITDLNLKMEYLFSKSFSTFIEVNNIFSQKYQRYLYYNTKGINVLVGLTYSF